MFETVKQKPFEDFPNRANYVGVFCILLVLPNIILGITTTHYNKPPNIRSSFESRTGDPLSKSTNLTFAERQKRLLPYINFYLTQSINQPYNEETNLYNSQRYQIAEIPTKVIPVQRHLQQQQPKFSKLIGATYQPDKTYKAQQIVYDNKVKFTPFLESNALPGPFIPIETQPHKTQPQTIKINYTPIEQSKSVPSFSTIYETLSQLKLEQKNLETQIAQQDINTNNQYFLRKPQHITFIPIHIISEQNSFPVKPVKTYVHSYTPTNIEISNHEGPQYESQTVGAEEIVIKSNANNKQEQQITPNIPVQINNPIHHMPEQSPTIEEVGRVVPIQPNYPETHYIVHQQKAYHNQNHKQYLQEIIPSSKTSGLIAQPLPYNEALKQGQIKIIKPIIFLQTTTTPTRQYVPEPISTQTYRPITNNHKIAHIVTPALQASTEPPNALSSILRKLQKSNTLPQNLTPDNIDNSIKTLVNILKSLKKQHKITLQPIIVPDEGKNYEQQDNEDDINLENPQADLLPGTVVQTFPANAPEGGTPGKPGVDYPALSNIPQTTFNCTTQRYKGFFADPDTHCQVWHYCDLNGGQASFLCPNGTIFSQVALTCDWWFNVKCSSTTQLYVLNERLYKYIIPLKPKFPEDYTGPLVDRYLAMKFEEMEEKMKREKSTEKPKDENDKDELQHLEDQDDKNTNEAVGT